MSSGRISLCIVVALSAGCRSHGDYRLRYEPDPVPRDARNGRAHFFIEVVSLGRRRVRVGRHGPWLEPGARLRLPFDLDAGKDRIELRLFDPNERLVTILGDRVRTLATRVEAEAAFPRPDLGGHAVRVTAGFHAPNHRELGRRHALDLVPRVGSGETVFGTEVRSPFAARVLAVTSDAPDRPGGRPNEIVLRSRDGRVWRLAHFERGTIRWRPGEHVERGSLLGRIGLSGRTTGPHLHIERLDTKQTRQ